MEEKGGVTTPPLSFFGFFFGFSFFVFCFWEGGGDVSEGEDGFVIRIAFLPGCFLFVGKDCGEG